MDNTEIVSNKNDNLAIFSQLFFCSGKVCLLAIKKAIVAIKDETNESTIKKCPICPGNKFSPINFMNFKIICIDNCKEKLLISST